MNYEDFHKPFLKSLIIVALVTIFTMVSSHYMIEYYMNDSIKSQKTPNYSIQQSQESKYSSVVE